MRDRPSIIVSSAGAWMTPYHDRMPVSLTLGGFDGWLSGERGSEVVTPAADSALRAWIVPTCVNQNGHGDDDPTLLDAVEDQSSPMR